MVQIITDSSTLFTEEEAKKMGIEVLPLCVNIGDLEGRDLQIDMQDFYNRIAQGGVPKSSQPPIGEVMEAYERYPEDAIINIAMADGLSGTYQSACGAKEMVDNKENITVVNTKTLCGPHRYMVQKAVRMKKDGCRLDKYAIKRNMKQAVSSVIERMKNKGVDAGYMIYVSHADVLEDAKKVVEQIKEHFADVDLEMLDLGAAFVTQGGPKCVAIQYIKK